MTICASCNLPHEPSIDGHPCIEAQTEAMNRLLQSVGDKGECRGCRAVIYWVTHRNGKKVPYTPAGLNHFIDCPAAKDFKR